MSKAALEAVTLTPEQEAERLWQGSEQEFAAAADDLARLCAALELGVRAAEVLAVLRLRTVKKDLPATIGMLLEHPPEEVDSWRDVVQMPKSLSFAETIDMLSEEGLECVTPHLHHGWEDRRRSCGRARETARRATGVTLDTATRDRLMILAAYRNRIFSTPPPVRIVPSEIVDAFPTLRELVQQLSTPA